MRLAAREADGWAAESDTFDALLPRYREALAAAGRDLAAVRIVLGFGGGRTGVDALSASPWVADPAGARARWREAGVDEVALTARTPEDIAALERMAGR